MSNEEQSPQANAVEPWRIHPPHESPDAAKVKRIAESMRDGGWLGRPLLVEPVAADIGSNTITAYKAWTGTHRLMAAMRVGIQVPVIILDMDRWLAAFKGALEPGQRLFDATGSTDEERLAYAERVGDTNAALLLAAEVRARKAACDG